MQETLVITFIATDRPGIVGQISNIVNDHQGNWLESRMVHLAEKFSGIITVQVPRAESAAVEEGLNALAQGDFHLLVENIGKESKLTGRLLHLDLVGPDHPGIVRDITDCLVKFGASVEELETDLKDAPFAGGKLFEARGTIRIPDSTNETALTEALEDLANALMVDLTFGSED